MEKIISKEKLCKISNSKNKKVFNRNIKKINRLLEKAAKKGYKTLKIYNSNMRCTSKELEEIMSLYDKEYKVIHSFCPDFFYEINWEEEIVIRR